LVRLFADEDVYNILKQLLSERGHDVVSTNDVGLQGVGDEVCFLHAATDSRVIVTHNGNDYALLHRAWLTWAGHWRIETQPVHHGVLVVPQFPLLDPESTASSIDQLLRTTSLTNTFYRLDRQGHWKQHG
jgi:hypothetical protein